MELPGKIYDAVMGMATYLMEVFSYPLTVLGEWFSGAKLQIQLLMAKAAKYIAEVLNVFGADEDDPAVIKAQNQINKIEREQRELQARVAERKLAEASGRRKTRKTKKPRKV